MDVEAALAHMRKSDPVLAVLIEQNPNLDRRAWMKALPKMDAFGVLIFQVAGQQLSIPATRSILARLAKLFGGRLPTPIEFLSASVDNLRATGMSRRKIETLRAVSERFASGEWREEELKKLSDQELERLLTCVKGIGPWTVQGFLMIAFDREDVVLPGDLAIRKIIRKIYEMDHMPSQQEVLQLAERWRPWRSLATGYLFQAAYGQKQDRAPTDM